MTALFLNRLRHRASVDRVFDHRGKVLFLLTLITLFFAYEGWRYATVKTHFDDFLPDGSPFVQEFLAHRRFSNPQTVTIVIKTHQGTVFNVDTLDKVYRITRAVDLIPGVDHDQIISLASRRVAYVKRVPGGIVRGQFMSRPPKNQADVAKVEKEVYRSPSVLGSLISRDEKYAVVRVSFVPGSLNYVEAFNDLESIVHRAQDPNNTVYATGHPMLVGWVLHYQTEGYVIILTSLVLASVFLALYLGNVVGLIPPLAALATSATWGVGFMALLGYNCEPLTIVVPVLLGARAMSHSIQATERFYELYTEMGDRMKAARKSLRSLYAPGTVGIFTDVAGIAALAIVPMAAMHKLAIFCAFWAASLIPLDVFLTPLLLSYLPVPKSAARVVGKEHPGKLTVFVSRLLNGFARVTSERAKWGTLAAMLLCVVAMLAVSSGLQIGSVAAGSPILAQSSPYNRAVRILNDHFAGTDTLQIIVAGKQNNSIREPDVMRSMLLLEHGMLEDKSAKAASSIADEIEAATQVLNGGYPKRAYVPRTKAGLGAVFQTYFGTSPPGELLDRMDFPLYRYTKVDVRYRDRTVHTINKALARARALITRLNPRTTDAVFTLGSGSIALQDAVNRAVQDGELKLLIIVSLVIGIMCACVYRSITAGILLMIPINVANLIGAFLMVLLGIGLNVNTLPVASVGMGVGIDYGLYLVTRICEEYQIVRDHEKAATRALQTTGKAIFMTGTVVLFAILPWYFLASLRFQADMGLLICVIVLADMFLALLMIPLMTTLLRPRFVERLFAGETGDQAAGAAAAISARYRSGGGVRET
jgi:uncharacterized protein